MNELPEIPDEPQFVGYCEKKPEKIDLKKLRPKFVQEWYDQREKNEKI